MSTLTNLKISTDKRSVHYIHFSHSYFKLLGGQLRFTFQGIWSWVLHLETLPEAWHCNVCICPHEVVLSQNKYFSSPVIYTPVMEDCLGLLLWNAPSVTFASLGCPSNITTEGLVQNLRAPHVTWNFVSVNNFKNLNGFNQLTHLDK